MCHELFCQLQPRTHCGMEDLPDAPGGLLIRPSTGSSHRGCCQAVDGMSQPVCCSAPAGMQASQQTWEKLVLQLKVSLYDCGSQGTAAHMLDHQGASLSTVNGTVALLQLAQMWTLQFPWSHCCPPLLPDRPQCVHESACVAMACNIHIVAPCCVC